VTGNEPTFTAYGGYHDAGDADRRTYHMDVTATLVTTYEAFQQFFTDDQYNSVHNPHDRESAFTKKNGWGPRPGILVFGPGGSGRGVSVPDVTKLARERRYIDNLGSIQWNEFTVYQSLCFPASVYPVLSAGGKWDESRDPFAARSN